MKNQIWSSSSDSSILDPYVSISVFPACYKHCSQFSGVIRPYMQSKEGCHHPRFTVLMAAFTHAIYIDESGIGAPLHGIQSYWVTTAIAISFSNLENLNSGSKSILNRYFRPGKRELKGTDMPNHLLKDASIDQVMAEIRTLLVNIDAEVWISSARNSGVILSRRSSEKTLAKAFARRTVLERVNDYLNAGAHEPCHFLIIWDISYQQELEDFSRSVARFRHSLTGKSLNPRLAPAILGGLSHDWSGLQIADIVAHCALHRVGAINHMPDANPSKARSFGNHLESICHVESRIPKQR